MAKELKVELLEEKEKDVIRFYFDEQDYSDIDLNSTEQKYLRNLYKRIIELVLSDNIKLELNYQEGYKKGLFKEIAEELVNDLNREIQKIVESKTSDLDFINE